MGYVCMTELLKAFVLGVACGVATSGLTFVTDVGNDFSRPSIQCFGKRKALRDGSVLFFFPYYRIIQ